MFCLSGKPRKPLDAMRFHQLLNIIRTEKEEIRDRAERYTVQVSHGRRRNASAGWNGMGESACTGVGCWAVWDADRAAGSGLAAHSGGRDYTDFGAHRVGEDAGGFFDLH